MYLVLLNFHKNLASKIFCQTSLLAVYLGLQRRKQAGDIGDFVKFALLRSISPGHKLGVAWYLYSDEGHNADGKHISYLQKPERWRFLDEDLFDNLAAMVTIERSVAAIEACSILNAKFSNEVLRHDDMPWHIRSEGREKWFGRILNDLAKCDLVFADPDNGLVDSNPKRRQRKGYPKRLPMNEVSRLAHGRPAIVYHHNSRFKGGHDLEVEHWLEQLGSDTLAVRANAFGCRTFFILNPTPTISERVEIFCEAWADHKVRLHNKPLM